MVDETTTCMYLFLPFIVETSKLSRGTCQCAEELLLLTVITSTGHYSEGSFLRIELKDHYSEKRIRFKVIVVGNNDPSEQ